MSLVFLVVTTAILNTDFLLEIQRVPLEKLCLRIKVLELFFGREIKVCKLKLSL